MKKTILFSVALALIAAASFAEVGFVSLQSITKYTSGTQGIGFAKNITGPIIVKPDAACTMFLNMTTLTRTKAGVGYPLAASTEHKFQVTPKANLTFTCATSAAVKNVYIVR